MILKQPLSSDESGRISLSENDKKTQITVHISKDETVEIKKTKTRKPGFYMIGNGIGGREMEKIDFIDEIIKSSTAGQWLISKIKDALCLRSDRGYIAEIKNSDLSKYEKNMLTSGFKELEARNLVARIKANNYMINPNALIPNEYEEAITLWNQIKLKKSQS